MTKMTDSDFAVGEFERLMSEMTGTLEELMPEEEAEDPPWSDFETVEEQTKETRRRKMTRRVKHHLQWKANQEKNPEVRNYYGSDDDGKGPLNWGGNQ